MNPASVLLAAVLAAALAGCAAPATAPGPAANASAASGAGNATMPPISRTLVVSLDVATPDQAAQEPATTEKGSVEVAAGYAHLRADAKWACATPACGFALGLEQEGQRLMTQQDASKGLDADVQAGAYVVFLRSTGPSAQMKGTITVTLT